MHQRQRAEMGAARERVVELVVVDHQCALVGHEVLEGVDAVGLDDDLHLVEHLLRPRRHRHVEAVVARCPLGFAPPVLIRRQHRLPGIGEAEIHDHRGAAGQRRLGARFEIVGGDGTHERHFEMGMRIDAAGHHVAAAGVDHLGARGWIDGSGNGGNRLAIDEDVGAFRMIVVDDSTAADQDGHGLSDMNRDDGHRHAMPPFAA